MEQFRPILKVAAVAVSACLVAAFVAYRAGAFDSLPLPAPEPQPEARPATAPAPASPATPDPSVFMLGSKSGFVYDESVLKAFEKLTPVQPATGTQSTTPANPVFMGGSKYIAPIFGPSITGPGSAEKSSQPTPPAPVPPKKDH